MLRTRDNSTIKFQCTLFLKFGSHFPTFMWDCSTYQFRCVSLSELEFHKIMAERAGFEPAVHLLGRTHDFQSCSFSRSDISPFLTLCHFDPAHAGEKSLFAFPIQFLVMIVSRNDKPIFKKQCILAERGGFEPPWELVAPKSISSRSRYDHFGTSPYFITSPKRVRMLPSFREKIY